MNRQFVRIVVCALLCASGLLVCVAQSSIALAQARAGQARAPKAQSGHPLSGGIITVTWTGAGGDDNWSTAANWDTGVVPDSSQVDVVIPAGSVVNLDISATVNSVDIGPGATLDMKGSQILQVDGAPYNIFRQNSKIGNVVVNTGGEGVTAGIEQGSNTVNLDGGGSLTFNPGGTWFPSSTVTNPTLNIINATVQGSAFITGLSVNNEAHGLLLANTATAPFDIELGTGNTLSNGGKVEAAGSTFTIDATAGGTLSNYDATSGALTGGTWVVDNKGTLVFTHLNGVTTDNVTSIGGGTTVTLIGDGAIESDGTNALLTLISNAGNFTLERGAGLTTTGSFTSSGNTTVGGSSSFIISSFFDVFSELTVINGKLTAPAGVNVTGGTLGGNGGTISGNVAVGEGSSDATFIIGDSVTQAGRISVTGTYTQGAAGTMDVQIGGTTAWTYSQLNATGAITLGGTLNIALVNGFTPTAGETFDIIKAPSGITGTFSTVNAPNMSVVYRRTGVEIEVN